MTQPVDVRQPLLLNTPLLNQWRCVAVNMAAEIGGYSQPSRQWLPLEANLATAGEWLTCFQQRPGMWPTLPTRSHFLLFTSQLFGDILSYLVTSWTNFGYGFAHFVHGNSTITSLPDLVVCLFYLHKLPHDNRPDNKNFFPANNMWQWVRGPTIHPLIHNLLVQ